MGKYRWQKHKKAKKVILDGSWINRFREDDWDFNTTWEQQTVLPRNGYGMLTLTTEDIPQFNFAIHAGQHQQLQVPGIGLWLNPGHEFAANGMRIVTPGEGCYISSFSVMTTNNDIIINVQGSIPDVGYNRFETANVGTLRTQTI